MMYSGRYKWAEDLTFYASKDIDCEDVSDNIEVDRKWTGIKKQVDTKWIALKKRLLVVLLSSISGG